MMINPSSDDPCGPGKKQRLFAPIRSINLRTAIPGPNSQAIMGRGAAAIGKRRQQLPLIVANAHGARVIDVDGNIFIDFAANAGTLIAGHTPQSVVEAIQAQADTLIHISSDDAGVLSETEIRLCELLNQVTPTLNGPKKTRLAVSGEDALRQAIRAAQAFSARSGILRRSDLQQPDAIHDPRNVAAIVIEPVDADFNPCDPQLMQRIAQQCREHGWLLIIDERRTGFGRTGKLFAIEHYMEHDEIQPDLLVMGEGLSGGMPLGAVIGRADVIDAVSEVNFGGSSLAYAAAVSTIDLIRDQNFPRRANQISEIVRERADEWQQDLPQFGELRGLGAMLALPLDSPQIAARVVEEALQNGLILESDPASNVIGLLYPLMIPEEQLYEGLDVLEAALRTVLTPDNG